MTYRKSSALNNPRSSRQQPSEEISKARYDAPIEAEVSDDRNWIGEFVSTKLKPSAEKREADDKGSPTKTTANLLSALIPPKRNTSSISGGSQGSNKKSTEFMQDLLKAMVGSNLTELNPYYSKASE